MQRKQGILQSHLILKQNNKTKQKNLEDFMLSEISQEQKGKYCSPSLYEDSERSNSQKLRVK